jgi:hypothetical protein
VLAKGKANKQIATDRLRILLDEQALLADVNGATTVAAMCHAFLEDALHNLKRQTYMNRTEAASNAEDPQFFLAVAVVSEIRCCL